MELILAGLLGTSAAGGALWAVVSGDARGAGVGLGLCALSVAAVCVLLYDAPVAAAVIIAVQGSLGVAAATRTPPASRRRAALPALVACLLFAALLSLCLTEPVASAQTPAALSDIHSLGLAGLAAVSVTLGIAGLCRRTERP